MKARPGQENAKYSNISGTDPRNNVLPANGVPVFWCVESPWNVESFSGTGLISLMHPSSNSIRPNPMAGEMHTPAINLECTHLPHLVMSAARKVNPKRFYRNLLIKRAFNKQATRGDKFFFLRACPVSPLHTPTGLQ